MNLFDDSKWIYERTEDNSARFVLGETGSRPLICIGVNPSTATPEKLDPTLAMVKRTANRFGFDGWIMLNLYPQRATNPDDLHKMPDSILMTQNFGWICKILKRYSSSKVWAAWGGLIEKRPYLKTIAETIRDVHYGESGVWVCRGPVSKSGHPHHPLYVKSSVPFGLFDFAGYPKKV